MTVSDELILEGFIKQVGGACCNVERQILSTRSRFWLQPVVIQNLCRNIYFFNTRKFLFCYHTNEINKLFMTQLQSNI